MRQTLLGSCASMTTGMATNRKTAAISLVIAGIISQIPALAFGGFRQMAIVLVLSDLVLYILMKLGLFKPRDRTV